MSQLKVANVRKCLDVLKQFHKDSGNEELKKRAGEALDHLDNLFAPKAGEFQLKTDCAHCGINIQST